MAKKKFLRRNTDSLSKLGLRRKKLQKWRAPKGRDNKMRLREKSYPRTVEIGYKTSAETRGKVNGMTPKMISCLADLKGIKEKEVVTLGRMGIKKRIELMKIVKDKKLKVTNLNVGKFLKKTEARKDKEKDGEKKDNDKKQAPKGVPQEGKEKKK